MKNGNNEEEEKQVKLYLVIHKSTAIGTVNKYMMLNNNVRKSHNTYRNANEMEKKNEIKKKKRKLIVVSGHLRPIYFNLILNNKIRAFQRIQTNNNNNIIIYIHV